MNQHGIGLGLVIAEKIVKNFRGSMNVESQLGQGSTFSFTFMLNNSDHLPSELTNRDQ